LFSVLICEFMFQSQLKLTPQERLKKKMQALLNRQCKCTICFSGGGLFVNCHYADYEECGVPGCNAVYFRKSLTFQGKKSPSSSVRKSKLSLVLLLVSCLAYFSTLKMEVICSSETSKLEEHTLHNLSKTEVTEW
jgi:amino acid permease